MSVLPFADPGELRAMARRIDAQAELVRGHARALVSRSASAHWYSRAASEFGAVVQEIGADLRRAADALAAAADALRRHADHVAAVLGALEHGVEAAVGTAEHIADSATRSARHAGGEVLHLGASALHGLGIG